MQIFPQVHQPAVTLLDYLLRRLGVGLEGRHDRIPCVWRFHEHVYTPILVQQDLRDWNIVIEIANYNLNTKLTHRGIQIRGLICRMDQVQR